MYSIIARQLYPENDFNDHVPQQLSWNSPNWIPLDTDVRNKYNKYAYIVISIYRNNIYIYI